MRSRQNVSDMTILRFLLRTVSVASRKTTVLLVFLAMIAINIGTLAFQPLAAAAGAMLARAGITTIADARAGEVATMRRQLDFKMDDLADMKRRFDTQAGKLADTERLAASRAEELRKARSSIAGLRKELASARSEIDSLRHVRYRGQTRTVRAAVADTADRVSRRTSTATARNLAVMPAEAVPGIGIAVVMAATAWELRDACALMQDVHELNVAFDPSLANDPTGSEVCGHEVPSNAEMVERLADLHAVRAALPDDYTGLFAFEKWVWLNSLMSWFLQEEQLSH
jgi:hypothetical protein